MKKKIPGCLLIMLLLFISVLGLTEEPHDDSTVVTLSQAITIALAAHTNVRHAQLTLQLTELELDAAWAGAILPTIDLQINPPNLTAEGFPDSVAADLTAGLSLPWGTSSTVSTGLDLTWDSDRREWNMPGWGINYSQALDPSQPDAASQGLKNKKQAVEDAQTALLNAKNAVILDTVNTYSNLLNAKAQLDQAREDLKQAQTNFEQIEELVNTGVKGKTELQTAQLALLDAQIALDEQQVSFTTDKEAFARGTLRQDHEVEVVKFQLPAENLQNVATDLLSQVELVQPAVQESSDVANAQQSVTEAQANLAMARRFMLPALLVNAGIDERGWTLGWTISFELFAPDNQIEVEMAKARLLLAEEKLKATVEQVRDSILSQHAALRKALNSIERLPLEQEKWSLEESVKKEKFEAGTISEDDWEEFIDGKQQFDLEVDERVTSLLLAYLMYKAELRLELEWEEWL